MFQLMGKHRRTTLSIFNTLLLGQLLSSISPPLQHLAWAAPAGGADPLILPANGEIPMDASFILPLTGAIVPPADAGKIPGNAAFDTEIMMEVDPLFVGEPMTLVTSGLGTAGADTDKPCTKNELAAIEEGIKQTVMLARAALVALETEDQDGVERYRRWFGHTKYKLMVKKVYQNMVDFAGLDPKKREDVFGIACPSDTKCRSLESRYIPAAQAGPGDLIIYAFVQMNKNNMYFCPNMFKKLRSIPKQYLPFMDLQAISETSITNVVMHEYGHTKKIAGHIPSVSHSDIFGAEDFAYSDADAKKLDSLHKVHNAQNYPFFALDAYRSAELLRLSSECAKGPTPGPKLTARGQDPSFLPEYVHTTSASYFSPRHLVARNTDRNMSVRLEPRGKTKTPKTASAAASANKSKKKKVDAGKKEVLGLPPKNPTEPKGPLTEMEKRTCTRMKGCNPTKGPNGLQCSPKIKCPAGQINDPEATNYPAKCITPKPTPCPPGTARTTKGCVALKCAIKGASLRNVLSGKIGKKAKVIRRVLRCVCPKGTSVFKEGPRDTKILVSCDGKPGAAKGAAQPKKQAVIKPAGAGGKP